MGGVQQLLNRLVVEPPELPDQGAMSSSTTGICELVKKAVIEGERPLGHLWTGSLLTPVLAEKSRRGV